MMHSSITPDNAELFSNPNHFRQLWALVMQRAIDDLLLQKKIRTDAGHQSKHSNSASRWIFGYDNKAINSFENVCLILDLDPVRMRKKIIELMQAKGVQVE